MAELAKKGRRGASPGVWAPRVDAWQCCEGDPGVRVVRGFAGIQELHGGRKNSPELVLAIRAAAGVGDRNRRFGRIPGVE